MWVTQRSRLSQLVDDAGGITVGVALGEAEALTRTLREAALAAVLDGVAALEALTAVVPAAAEADAWLGRVYGLAYQLLELAGPFGLDDMCAAAHSLCALADGQRRLGRLSPEPIALHVAAIRLLVREGESAETRKAVLEGLAHISERAARAGT
jgi:hypothetical protein